MASQTMLQMLGSTTAAWTLPGDDPASVGKARTLVRGALANLPDEVTDDAVYALNEMFTNAIKYTKSALKDGLVAMAVTVAASTVTVAVLDEGPLNGSVPTLEPVDRINSGWGLASIKQLGDLHIDPVDGAGHLVSVDLNVKEVPA